MQAKRTLLSKVDVPDPFKEAISLFLDDGKHHSFSGFTTYPSDNYERKGYLKKKSTNSINFKQRFFVLHESRLAYFKSESQSKLSLFT